MNPFHFTGEGLWLVRIPNYHTVGAMKAVTDGSEHACLNRCDEDPLCLVAEYDSNDGSCWVHMEGSAGICGTFYDNPGVFHYEKIPCGEYIFFFSSGHYFVVPLTIYYIITIHIIFFFNAPTILSLFSFYFCFHFAIFRISKLMG